MTTTADPTAPEARLAQVFDDDPWTMLSGGDNTSGVLTARGRVAGVPAIAYCTDARRMGGTLGAEECRHIVNAIDTAVREHCPVIGLWHSGGARLGEGVEALDGVGRVFDAMVRASGLVPQVSVVLGQEIGGAAYCPALTDIVVMVAEGRIVTGPHDGRSGVVHVTTKDEHGAYAHARQIVGLLGSQGEFDADSVRPGRDLLAMLPRDVKQPYDVKPFVRAILDTDADGQGVIEELRARWAPSMLTGLGRLGGRTVGVVANNTIYHEGRLTSAATDKAAQFIGMCDSFGIPLVVIADVPHSGDVQSVPEPDDVQHWAKLIRAFASAAVPRVTLLPRKAYGAGYVAMNSRSLGATAVFAWGRTEVAVMSARSMVRSLHHDALAAVPVDQRGGLFTQLVERQRIEGDVDHAVRLGVVDEVIEPRETGLRIMSALAGGRS